MGDPPSHHPDASAPSAGLSPPAGAPPAPDPFTPDVLLRFVQEAVIGTDLGFRITSWNPGAEALYGWAASEVIGQTIPAVLHTQFLDDAEEQVLAQFQATGSWRGEVLQQHRDGHALAIMSSVALVRSPAGEPLGAVSVNRDIRERKAALARLDALIRSLPIGVGYLDHELRYQLVNPALAALNGHTPAAHVGRTMSEIIPALAPRLEPLAHQVLATGEAIRDLELHSQPPCPIDGTLQNWLISYFPVHDSAGAVTGVGVTVINITATTRTTAALRETERKLTTLFELLPVGVSVFDASGRVVAMNPAQEAIFRRQQAGLAREGVLDRPFFRPDGTPRPREELATERVLRERQPALDVESGFVSATGEAHWITVSAVPVEFPDWRVVAVTSDITARKRDETTLREQATLLDAAYVLVRDMESRIIAWNQGAYRLYGWTAAEALGQVSHELLQTSFSTSLALIQAELLATGRWEGELVHRCQDGHEVVVASLWVLFRDASGAPRRILEVNNDVTAQRRAEQALRERDEQLRLAHEAAQLGTWWRDPAMGLLHVDARAQTHFGLATDVAPVAELLARIHPDDRALWRQAVATTTDLVGDGRATAEYRVVHPDGSIHWLAVHARAYFAGVGPERRPVTTSGISQDITARKQAEEQVRVALATEQVARGQLQQLSQRLLEAQEQERRHLARELHDEVGQALGALKINLHVLHIQPADAAAAQRLSESLEVIDTLIQQMRALSLELRPSVLDDLGLAAALGWYCDRLQQRADLAVAFADYLGGAPVPPLIATACFRIAQEALTNVVRHAHARHVAVTLSRQERTLALSVCDDGVGFVVEDGRAQAIAGASLGLISMTERAELVGGWVEISSVAGEGTEVWAWLPLKAVPSDD